MIDLGILKGRKIAVMGLARSGLTAARAALDAGAEVLAWDDGVAGQQAAQAEGIALTDLNSADLAGVELLVLSPGIPHCFPEPNKVAARAKAAGIPLISDIELLARAVPAPFYVGITGTNGKSTTTALTGHIFAGANRPTLIGGNIGIPALSIDRLGKNGVYVLEMSSYQLELTPSLGFDAAVLLNITPDHLDRHGGMDGYIAAKKRIFQKGDGRPQVAIIGVDDEPCRQMADALEREFAGRVIRLSVHGVPPGGIGVEQGVLVDATEGTRHPFTDLTKLATLPGQHNWQNALAAYALARAGGLTHSDILDGLRTFPGLAHRQQQVAVIDGVRFINDSKATNADAAAKALVCYQPIYWILGGKPKDTGLAGLEELVGNVRHAFLIGEATEAFAGWLADHQVPHTRCGVMEKAVAAAFAAAKADGEASPVVLLSPACASFDQYPNFEVRGDAFTAAAQSLATTRQGD
ncbi:UDP-N-acetylmuramoyl-L-alanine--D-glutamate ligase [Niveispirillum sp. SYP-B3756]|uniref:UDP-N-acetylmuramoyl-L-alanine--D-glutamate ligase n=1 Tax=Niveispirillum sp. SYP-B3756 TaxID=2662178 RepID=UPI001290FC6A|nr:UDP-N-acetylmuramoyl-L-alanine--D-glutamate ligase [Niveispirillum sp. SYP-B3756]MQP67126.1 UDP-N-acetylmuramoyl-L-alanine--D-glutamate ligase [Niveispirillum sp. SYP-B3756]